MYVTQHLTSRAKRLGFAEVKINNLGISVIRNDGSIAVTFDTCWEIDKWLDTHWNNEPI
jgi:hypothetical protein